MVRETVSQRQEEVVRETGGVRDRETVRVSQRDSRSENITDNWTTNQLQCSSESNVMKVMVVMKMPADRR